MKTQIEFPSQDNKYWCYHSKNFPIDLKIGETIWFDDFKDFFEIGEIYLPEDNEIYEKTYDKTMCIVIEILYGMQNQEIIKIITLKEL